MPIPLSPATRLRLDALFAPSDSETAALLLVERCGNNLPCLESLDAISLERFRFAALKLSGGSLDRLRSAVDQANLDWRDLLVEAGFADDLRVHEAWFPD